MLFFFLLLPLFLLAIVVVDVVVAAVCGDQCLRYYSAVTHASMSMQ